MRRAFISGSAAAILAAMLLAAGPRKRLEAGRKMGLTPRAPGLELVVVELDGCPHCARFRETIAPGYRKSWLEGRAPLRFVEADAFLRLTPGLRQSVDIVPTAILMADGVEIDRVAGLMAPETFFDAVTLMIERAGE